MGEKFRRGMAYYASLLHEIKRKPMTSHELSLKFDGVATVENRARGIAKVLRRLAVMGVVHVHGWKRRPEKMPEEVWRFGPGVSVPMPPLLEKGGKRTRLKPCTFPMRIEVFTFGQIMIALRDGHTRLDLVDLVGSSERAIYPLITHMHAIHLIRVSEWMKPATGQPIAVFQIGGSADAPMPARLTKRETNIRARVIAKDRHRRGRDLAILHALASPVALPSVSR